MELLYGVLFFVVTAIPGWGASRPQHISDKFALFFTSSPGAAETSPANTASVPPSVRGIHLSAWVTGSEKYRKYLDELLAQTVLNSVVIDIKDETGTVFVPGVPMVERTKAYEPAIPDLQTYLANLKSRGIYTVARIVVFRDNRLPRHCPECGVKNGNGDLWRDRKKITWINPYHPEGRRYNLLIALQAVKLGFDEIQFDYIRFPSDGVMAQIRYPTPHTPALASAALGSFVKEAAQLLHPLGAKISVDVFGLTTTIKTGMGIGQQMEAFADHADYICPMVYPSHYYHPVYGVTVPNKEPYKIVWHALRDALNVLGPDRAHKLRPYLQDFSLGYRYGPDEVRAQIQAAADHGITSWTLWNAGCRYTREAIRTLPIPQKSTATTSVSRPRFFFDTVPN